MKKIFLTLGIASVAFLAVNCSKDKSTAVKPKTQVVNQNIYLQAGQLHNEAMTYIVNKYKETHPNSLTNKSGAPSLQDSLDLLQFVQEQTRVFLADKSIDNVNFTLSNTNFSNAELLNLIDNNIQSTGSSSYSLVNLYNTTTATTVSDFNNEVDQLVASTRLKISDEKEFNNFLMSASILKASNEYWQNPPSLTGKKHNLVSTQGEIGLALTDVTGAVDAGVWGLAAGGPLGGVVVGVSGGIIASSASFLFDSLW